MGQEPRQQPLGAPCRKVELFAAAQSETDVSDRSLQLALFAWLISHQPIVLFSHIKPATSNQSAVLFSHNKPAPAISHQPTEQAEYRTIKRDI
jgi:hypothetical protein